MEISSTYSGQIYDAEAVAAATTEKDKTLGQDAFLKMFMAQLTHQDPLNPMDSTEFTSQLATFSQLEQLTKIAGSMDALDRLETTMTQTQMVGYIGKEVSFSGDVLPKADGQIGRMNYTLENKADVRALVFDSAGKVVADVDLGSLAAGELEFAWDGKTSAGQDAPDGLYRVSLIATDSNGDTVTISDQTVTAMVTGYQKDADGNAYLLLGEAALSADEVLSVQQPKTTTNSSTTGAAEDSSVLDSILSALGTVGGLAAALI